MHEEKMAERSGRTAPLDRGVEKAIVALKKGAHLLKCGRRGRPKFYSFRLSPDEKALVWYSGEKEKHLKLNTVSKIVLGQKTVNFLRQPHPGKESQSFSLIYQNGERSLDLICKDKEQAESWFLGLTALVYASHHPRRFSNFAGGRVVRSCANSPASYMRRKHNLGLTQDSMRFSKVQSLYGSPPWSQMERYISDSVLDSSDVFHYSRQNSLSDVQSVIDKLIPHSLHVVSDRFMDTRDLGLVKKKRMPWTSKISSIDREFASIDRHDVLKDIFMWGEGVGGILGGDTNAYVTSSLKHDALSPKLVESTRMLDVLNISCGERHAALVTRQGAIFCWGEENGGKLGHKMNMDVPHPKVVESLTSNFVQSIDCGAQHTCAVTNSGELYAWGDSSHGVGLSGDGRSRIQWFPHRICGPLNGICASKVACGEWHTAVVSTSGQLFTFGDGTFGVLGHGNGLSLSQPKEVESLKGMRVKSIACGPWHTAAVVETMVGHYKSSTHCGKLFTWGDNDKGRLGHADMERKLVPTCVASLIDFDFVQVSCGRILTVALTVTGIVFTMGSAANGQLGNPQAEDKSIATVEGLLKSEFVKEISSGSFHVAVLTTKGKVYAWGKGANGRLGLGDTKDRNSPALVEALDERHVTNVACGSSFTAAVCLRKSTLIKDQSVCSGCRLIFGFTKKKYNCSNCGYAFCHSCSSKRATNAFLAPNKTKNYRVCDLCYSQLQKPVDFRMKEDVQSPRLPLITRKANKEETLFTRRKIFSPKVSIQKEVNLNIGKAVTKQGNEWANQDRFSSSAKTQRWGQVSCPWQLNDHAKGNSKNLAPVSKEELSDVSHVHAPCSPSNSVLPSATSLKQKPTEVDKMFAEELQRLYAEAKILRQQCQSKHQRLQQYKHKIEETWSVARDEAAKFKAAKEFIRALTNQMNVISEKISGGRQLNNIRSIIDDKVDFQTAFPSQTKVSESEDRMLAFGSKHFSCDAEIMDRRISSTEGTDGTLWHHNVTMPIIDKLKAESNMRKFIPKDSQGEWVQQDEPGVYITFIALPSGRKGLKRVRFSRKHFSVKEAELWWEENQSRIYRKYNIERIVSSATGKIDN